MKRSSLAGFAAALAWAVGLAPYARAQTNDFEARPMTDGGGANIANPYGGVYVYRAALPDDGRRPSRAVLGERARTEFTLFSAEEEDALWRMRDRLLHPAPPLSVRRTRQVTSTHPALADRRLVWPKVVLQGSRTCVPELAFSEAPDWREHLVCWSSEVRRVE